MKYPSHLRRRNPNGTSWNALVQGVADREVNQRERGASRVAASKRLADAMREMIRKAQEEGWDKPNLPDEELGEVLFEAKAAMDNYSRAVAGR